MERGKEKRKKEKRRKEGTGGIEEKYEGIEKKDKGGEWMRERRKKTEEERK